MADNIKTDRRIVRTKKAIQDAFVELLKQKGLEGTTVSDIVEACDINRGTFYLHYKDKYDLLNQMQEEFLGNLARALQKSCKNLSSSSTPGEECRMFAEYILSYLTAIWENSDLIRLFFDMSGEFDFKEKLRSFLEENLLKGRYPYLKVINSQVPFKYLYSYMSGAGIHFLMAWIEGGMQEKPEEIADIFMKLHVQGVQSVMYPESIE